MESAVSTEQIQVWFVIETVDETHVFCGCSSEDCEHSDKKSGIEVRQKAVYNSFFLMYTVPKYS